MIQTWKKILLKDACEVFADGDWIESKDQSTDGIRLIQTGNIGFGYFKDKEDKSRYISEETFFRLKCTEILPGDLLVSRLPDPVGKSCIIPEINSKMITGVDCTIIRPKDNLSSEFLCYYQMSNQYLNDVQSGISGSTRQRISRKNLGLIEIPLPPLPEQQRIVAILDEAFNAIAKAKANAEQNHKNAKELFESYLKVVFENKGKDWEEKKLGEVVDFFNGFAFKSKDVIETSNTQLIRMGNLYQNKLSLDRRAVFYPDDFAVTYKKFLLKANDLIISLTGTTDKEDYGYTVRIPENEYNLLLNQRIAKIIIKNEKATNKDYLFHFLLSRTFLDKLYKTANGTRQANLSTETMRGLTITIPNIKQQQVIVQKLDALSAETEKLEAIYLQKINDLEELKKSVLQKAFSGELKTEKLVML
jgi:type I restriction enzyme S subunit